LESRARSILPLSNLHRPLPFNRSLMPLSRIPSPFTSLSRKVNMQDRAVIYRNLSGEQPIALVGVGRWPDHCPTRGSISIELAPPSRRQRKLYTRRFTRLQTTLSISLCFIP
jgi:hypothetical protein